MDFDSLVIVLQIILGVDSKEEITLGVPGSDDSR